MGEEAARSVGEYIAHFRILGWLGRGGMGVVYRAEDETLRRTVALKLLSEGAADEEIRQRFLREARSAAAISHPNVAAVHQVGEADGHIFIAMELVEGETLRAKLERGRIEVAAARDFALQIARGLAAAHEKGIVHRDLKPENVLITPAGVVKILDFGLAKTGHDRAPSTDTDVALAKTTLVTHDKGRVMGTPAYMSPEQGFGERLDVRSDVFSFGIVLYEMLAGTRPFLGSSAGAVLVAISRDPAPPLRERAPGLDAATEAVVARCLAKAPDARFASGVEIVSALTGQTSPAATTSSRLEVEPLVRTEAPRARSMTVPIAAALLTVAAVAGGAWTIAHRTASPSPASSGLAQPPSAPDASRSADWPRSTSADAQRSLDEAMRSYHDGTGQTVPLLQSAVKADPSFGGAYLRLWWLADRGLEAHELADEYHRRVVALDSSLSPRNHALLDALEEPDRPKAYAKLDAYLARYPDDDVAWIARLDNTRATIDRAFAAVPTLAPLFAAKSMFLRGEPGPEVPEVAATLATCLELHPRAVSCLAERATVLDGEGECAAAEVDVRRWLELQPDSREAPPMLAGLLAGQGAPTEAMREVLGHDPHAWGWYVETFEALVPLYEGDFHEAERRSMDAFERVPATADMDDHFTPVGSAVRAYEEEGDRAGAARLASDFLARLPAWKAPKSAEELAHDTAVMVGAAARGGRMKPAEAALRLDALMAAALKRGDMTPQRAWANVYAASSETQDEALVAVAKLDALQLPSLTFQDAIGIIYSTARVLTLAGRYGQARPFVVNKFDKECGDVFLNTRNWVHMHLYEGEIYEHEGNAQEACAQYAKVIGRWEHAKPRSVTVDEARARAAKLGCGR